MAMRTRKTTSSKGGNKSAGKRSSDRPAGSSSFFKDKNAGGEETKRPFRGNTGFGDEKPKRSFGDAPKRAYRGKPSADGDRPKKSFGGDDTRPPYRGKKDFDGDRPKRSFGGDDAKPPYRGKKDFDGDRPKRSFGGDDARPPYRGKKEFDGDHPKRSFGGDDARPPYRGKKEFDGDRPKRSFGGDDTKPPYRGKKDFDGDRPKRSFGGDDARPPYRGKKEFDGDRPKRSFGGDDARPPYRGKKDFDGDRPKRSFGGDDAKRSYKPKSDFSAERNKGRDDSDSEFEDNFEGKDEEATHYRPSKSFSDKKSKGKNSKKKEARRNGEDLRKNPEEGIRLNKYIANSGVCSRREADEFITAGLVSVNGEVITTLGTRVKPTDEVKYGGERLKNEKMVYVLLNKPKDYITTTDDPRQRKTVMELVKSACKERIYPVGRLDRNTTGLLLLTNDGEMAEKLMHPSSRVKKTYMVELNKNLKVSDMQKIAEGLELEDGIMKVDEIAFDEAANSKKIIGVTIHSGRNRIVRRIFEHLDYMVVKLDRTYYAGLTKRDLPRGRCRHLDEMELNMLKMLKAK